MYKEFRSIGQTWLISRKWLVTPVTVLSNAAILGRAQLDREGKEIRLAN